MKRAGGVSKKTNPEKIDVNSTVVTGHLSEWLWKFQFLKCYKNIIINGD
jgi:hypothetical protein